MNYIGYPISNDPLYGKSKKATSFGQMLHAKKLIFTHPFTKKEMVFESKLPKEFNDLLEELTNV